MKPVLCSSHPHHSSHVGLTSSPFKFQLIPRAFYWKTATLNAPRSVASPVGKASKMESTFKSVCKDLFLPLLQLPNLHFCWAPLHNECYIGIHRIPELSSFSPQMYVIWRAKKLKRKTQNFLVMTVAVVEYISHRAILFGTCFCPYNSLGPPRVHLQGYSEKWVCFLQAATTAVTDAFCFTNSFLKEKQNSHLF